MKIKLDFITNSSSTNYTIAGKEREKIEIKVEGITFDLLKQITAIRIYKNINDLEEIKNSFHYDKYKELILDRKVIYEFWTSSDGGNLIESFLHLNDIRYVLPEDLEFVDVYLGG
jgi:hypothetical protein